ncbi:MAG: ribosome recycling factor [Longimicrobiales bacterium]
MTAHGEVRSQMERAVEAVRREFSGVRTGKATPTLLDLVRVEAYGSKMPLNQVATVNAPEPRLLIVQPWDKGLIAVVEKAIRAAELGLNPASDGSIIRVPIPPLNEERRREMVKLLHKMAEEGRIGIRQHRHDANKQIRNREQNHEIGADDARRQTDEIQKLTDEFIGRIDDLLRMKEQEVMEV